MRNLRDCYIAFCILLANIAVFAIANERHEDIQRLPELMRQGVWFLIIASFVMVVVILYCFAYAILFGMATPEKEEEQTQTSDPAGRHSQVV